LPSKIRVYGVSSLRSFRLSLCWAVRVHFEQKGDRAGDVSVIDKSMILRKTGFRTLPARLETLLAHAGLASAVVPFAIAVHLVAEGIAIGAVAALPSLLLRHIYLVVPLAVSLWVFGATLGLGSGRAEIVRRCALLRHRLRASRSIANAVFFVAANLAFFGLTQVLEGDPIAAGSLPLALVAAVCGAVLSAIIFFTWGTALGRAVLTAMMWAMRPQNRPLLNEHAFVIGTRRASVAFSLFVPNRPPPATSFS
jgi:hypothetical protein